MTEADWLESTDLRAMLWRVSPPAWHRSSPPVRKASPRKLRLFAVACCRRLPESAEYARAREALAVAERFADGEASEDELRQAREGIGKALGRRRDSKREAAQAAQAACALLTEPF